MKLNTLILLAMGLTLAGCLSPTVPSADATSVRDVPKPQVEKRAESVMPEVENARKAARERFAADAAAFDRATRREIERLYRKASSRSDGAAEALKTLMEKYPKANRTGCAVMYAAQRETDPAERERLLKLAIASFGDCYYGDGAQVAPYARWYLAKLYERTGKPDEAKRLFDEIRTDYPNAVTHRGGPFAAWLPTSR